MKTINRNKMKIRKAFMYWFIVMILSSNIGIGQNVEENNGSFHVSLGATYNHNFQKLNQDSQFEIYEYSVHTSGRIAAGYTFPNKLGMEFSYTPVEHYFGWQSINEGLSYIKNRRLFLSHVFSYNVTNEIDLIKNKFRIVPKCGFGIHFWKEPAQSQDIIGNIGQYIVTERSEPYGGNSGLLLEGGIVLEYDLYKSLTFYGGSTFYKGFKRQHNIYLSSSDSNNEIIQGSVDGSFLSFEFGLKYQFEN